MQVSQLSHPSPGVTRQIAGRVLAYNFELLPQEIVQVAKQCFLDWLGVTIAGSQEPVGRIIQDEAEEQGGRAQATLLGDGRRTSTQQAALANGTASHALDYDDVHQTMMGHPSVAIFSALLALGESREVSGRDFLTAFVAGFEGESRVGAVIGRSHYLAGFHATGTIGAFGSALACARLMGLSPEAGAVAMGIAATQAAGLKSMFGTMCKPLHAGKAAVNGLLAASLASRGFTSRDDVLECEQGFASTHTTSFRPDKELDEPSSGFHVRDTLFKYHAACYMTHASMEAAHRMRKERGIAPEQVESVRVRVQESLLTTCNIPAPQTGLEAKFSLTLTTAMALAGKDTSAIGTFSDDNANDPALSALRDRVSVEIAENGPNTLSEVVMEMKDGGTFSERVDVGIPAEDLEQQGRKLEAKFHSLVAPVLGEERSKALAEKILNLESIESMAEITRLCGQELS